MESYDKNFGAHRQYYVISWCESIYEIAIGSVWATLKNQILWKSFANKYILEDITHTLTNEIAYQPLRRSHYASRSQYFVLYYVNLIQVRKIIGRFRLRCVVAAT